MNIVTGNASDLIAISPNDTVLLTKGSISIYVGNAGNLTVITELEWQRQSKDESLSVAARMAACTKVLISNCPAGFILNARVVAVMVTGTTASALVGFLP